MRSIQALGRQQIRFRLLEPAELEVVHSELGVGQRILGPVVHGTLVELQRVRSLVIEPDTNAEIERGEVAIRGVAWSGAAPIARVDVSINGGPWTGPFNFTVTVQDFGGSRDTFKIQISDPGGTVAGSTTTPIIRGNIQQYY